MVAGDEKGGCETDESNKGRGFHDGT
jgi:hypothetical protein